MCKSSSLSRCLMMPFGVSHRCFTIVMQRMCCQKVVIACGQFVLYLCRDGASQRCQWMPLCSVALSPHVLSLAKYLTMVFEKIHKIPIPPNCHLSCHSSVHSPLKVIKQLVTEWPHGSGRNSNLRSEVREFHLFQNCIASWFNGSHYRCWCLWRPPRLGTDGTFHNRKSEKGKTVFLRLRKLISTLLKHFQALFHTHTVVGPIRPIRVANVQEFFSLKMSYDAFWCFTSMFYHRHAENVLSKGGHCVWTIRVISLPWWGVPKMPVDATVFCRFVTSCIVTCQISHHGVWEDSQNPNPT